MTRQFASAEFDLPGFGELIGADWDSQVLKREEREVGTWREG